jgi:hypothetical protein
MATANQQVYMTNGNLKGCTLNIEFYLTFLAYSVFQLQKAAKLLDSGAVRATRFLWRHPVARVSLLFYLVRTAKILLPVFLLF